MGQQYAVTYRKVQKNSAGQSKRYNVNIGTAFASDEGGKHYIVVKLNAMPIPEFWKDGELVLFPQEPRGEAPWRQWDEEFPK